MDKEEHEELYIELMRTTDFKDKVKEIVKIKKKQPKLYNKTIELIRERKIKHDRDSKYLHL